MARGSASVSASSLGSTASCWAHTADAKRFRPEIKTPRQTHWQVETDKLHPIVAFERPRLSKVRELPQVGQILVQGNERAVLERRRALEPLAQIVNGAEDVPVVHLAGARLVPAGDVADVEVADSADVGAKVVDQIPFHNLDVVEVAKDSDVGARHAVNELGRVAHVVEKVAGVVHVSVQDFDDGRDVIL